MDESAKLYYYKQPLLLNRFLVLTICPATIGLGTNLGISSGPTARGRKSSLVPIGATNRN